MMGIDINSGLFDNTSECILVIAAVIILIISTGKNKSSTAWNIAFIASILAAFISGNYIKSTGWHISSYVTTTAWGASYSDYLMAVFKPAIATILALGLMLDYREGLARPKQGILLALLLISTAGAMALSNSAHLFVTFLSLEIMSIPICTIALHHQKVPRRKKHNVNLLTAESAATAFMLLGFALYYASSGSLATYGLYIPMSAYKLFSTTTGLIILSLLIKGIILPLIAWSSNTIDNSPDLYLALLAGISITATFQVLVRFLPEILPYVVSSSLIPILMSIALLMMLAGSILIIASQDIKKILGHSALFHSGFILLGLIALRTNAVIGIMFYIAAFVPAFVIASHAACFLKGKNRSFDITDYHGAALRNPYVGIIFSLSLLSLSGLPPLTGFMATLFTASGLIQVGLLWPVVFALIALLPIAYKFATVIITVLSLPSHDNPSCADSVTETGIVTRIAYMAVAVFMLAFGISPAPLLYQAAKAIDLLGKYI